MANFMDDSTINIFEKASRCRLRFNTGSGTINVEDLWDLPLTSPTTNGTTNRLDLDTIARGLYHQIKAQVEYETSFVEDISKADPQIQLRFDIVKRVIEVKKQNRDRAAEEKTNAELRQTILRIKHNRSMSELEGMSDEELDALLNKGVVSQPTSSEKS